MLISYHVATLTHAIYLFNRAFGIHDNRFTASVPTSRWIDIHGSVAVNQTRHRNLMASKWDEEGRDARIRSRDIEAERVIVASCGITPLREVVPWLGHRSEMQG